MRQEVINYLKSQKFVSYKVSEELPFSNSDTVMYIKNPKVIYVDADQHSTETIIPVFNAVNVDAEITTVRVFFSNDSKKQPSDYSQVIEKVRNIKNLGPENGYFRTAIDISVEQDQDLTVTTFEFRFTKLS